MKPALGTLALARRHQWRLDYLKLVIVPVSIAAATLFLTVYSTNNNIKKEYVSLSIQILSSDAMADSSSAALRPWAVELLNRFAPVPLPHDMQTALSGGTAYLPPNSRDNASTGPYTAALSEPTTEAPLESIKLINSTLALLKKETRDPKLEAKVILELSTRRDSILRQQFGARIFSLLLRLRTHPDGEGLTKEQLDEVEPARLWERSLLKAD